MNWWLAYQIAIGVALAIVGAWAVDARRMISRMLRLAELRDYYDPPTEEIELPPTMSIGPRLEDFGPGKPLPPLPLHNRKGR